MNLFLKIPNIIKLFTMDRLKVYPKQEILIN